MAESIRSVIGDENPDAQFLNPRILDKAIVGFGGRPGEPPVAIYCRNRISSILEDLSEMDPEILATIVLGTSDQGLMNMPIIAFPLPERDYDSDF